MSHGEHANGTDRQTDRLTDAKRLDYAYRHVRGQLNDTVQCYTVLVT